MVLQPVSIITPFIQESPLQKSTPALNISTKSLVHATQNPFSSPVSQHGSKIKRNQSFHGFQLSSRVPGTNTLNAVSAHVRPNQIFQNQGINPFYPMYQSNLNVMRNSNLGWSNQIYGGTQNSGNNTIGPLILAPNPSRFMQNRHPSIRQFVG